MRGPGQSEIAGRATLMIVGIEALILGTFAILITSRLRPGTVLGVHALLAAAALLLRRRFAAALSVSFLSTVPGILFSVELVNRNGRLCESLPMSGLSSLWLLVGPALFVISAIVSPPRSSPPSLLVLHAIHLVVWLFGSINSFGCAMTI